LIHYLEIHQQKRGSGVGIEVLDYSDGILERITRGMRGRETVFREGRL